MEDPQVVARRSRLVEAVLRQIWPESDEGRLRDRAATMARERFVSAFVACEALFAAMQRPEARTATDRGLHATPAEMGTAAVGAATPADMAAAQACSVCGIHPARNAASVDPALGLLWLCPRHWPEEFEEK